jgi:rhomboid protease GluP
MDPLPSDSAAAPAETSFVVDFNAYVAGNYNRDFGGSGRLEVRAAEPRFVFTARPRRMLTLAKQPVELAFRSAEIWNVARHGAGIEFTTTRGKCGAKKIPFVFTCVDENEAVAVAALLPDTRDADRTAADSFMAQLRRLPDASSGLGSITNLVLIANVAAFIVMGFLGAGWFEVASMKPYVRFGANNGGATTDGEWWRLVTSMFLHYGLVHLLLNAWALFQVGHLVEKLFGRRLYTLLYFGSGIIGGLTTLWWKGDRVWSAGASGAVFGVYGALIGYLLRERAVVPTAVLGPMLRSTLLFAGYNLVYGAVHPRIDNAAHLGGLLGGFVLGWCCALPIEPEQRAASRRRRGATGLAAAALLVTIGVVAAPRFDYRVQEEFAWSDVITPRSKREPALLQQEAAAIRSYEKDPRSRELASFIPEAISFYEQWLTEITALTLDPDRSTAARREIVASKIRQRLARFRTLAADLEAKSPDALRRYLVATLVDAPPAASAPKKR